MNNFAPGPIDVSQSRHAKWRNLPANAARIIGGVLATYQQSNRAIGLEHGYNHLASSGNFHNLELAAGLKSAEKDGKFRGPQFMDSDVYKWLEALALEHLRQPDDKFVQWMDQTIALLEKAQASDGYLDSFYQVAEPAKRWKDISNSHELYCAGHLIQATVAHARATASDRLLNITLKFVRHIQTVFGPEPGKLQTCCGHPEIESALLELYRLTRDPSHLALAQFFLDMRGRGTLNPSSWTMGGPAYMQDTVQIREATEVVGHSVRQLYLTAGATDAYLETGDKSLLDAMHRLWRDMVESKMYITGGVGSRHGSEAFGAPYELPQAMAYCETCAAIASMFWNFRLLLATGESMYADLFEHTLYNAVLCSVSLDGSRCFYVNPLATDKGSERPEWHGCACCPPNVMRLFSSLQAYLATGDENSTQIHLYAPAVIQRPSLTLRMNTRYPYDGKIEIVVESASEMEHELSLRIPDWCDSPSLRLNGQTQPMTRGYATIRRVFRKGDRIELDLPMRPQFVRGHSLVESTRNCVALRRGPLIYCFEAVDQAPNVDIRTAYINPNVTPSDKQISDMPDGALLLESAGAIEDSPQPSRSPYPLYSTLRLTNCTLRAIPYFLWANRAPGAMRIWLPAAR